MTKGQEGQNLYLHTVKFQFMTNTSYLALGSTTAPREHSCQSSSLCLRTLSDRLVGQRSWLGVPA